MSRPSNMRARSLGLNGLFLAMLLGAIFAPTGPAATQGLGLIGGDSEGPLEIDAEDGIEWLRNENKYVATGNARAARGGVELKADELIAHYRSTPDGATEIWRLEAIGNVRIVSATETARGDLGVYDVDAGKVTLTGGNLELTTGTDRITARDSLEYWDVQQVAYARGNAVARRADRVVRGELLKATFREDGKGGLVARLIEAKNSVCVQSAAAVARGQYGNYNVDTGIALLQVGVRIAQGPNLMVGDDVEINMNTGVSRLLGKPTADGKKRVSGLIIPGSGGEDKSDKPKKSAVPLCL